MRPKKSILLYCPDRELLSTLAFALRLHPYDVAAIDDARDAVRISTGKDAVFACGVLIHIQPGDPCGRLVHRLLEADLHISVLLVDRAGDLAPVRYVDMVLYGRNTSMEHILGALNLLCVRKRGPQPGSVA